jgi:WD40 repeat protein
MVLFLSVCAARVVRVLTEHPQSVYGIAWVSTDLLITGCDEGRVIGHDLRSAQPAWSYNLNDVLAQQRGESLRRGICCMALLNPALAGNGASNHIHVAAGCIGGFVTTFNAVNGQILSHDQLHGDDVRSISVLPGAPRAKQDNSFELLTASYDSTVAVWSTGYSANGLITYRKQGTTILRGHSDKVLGATPVVMPGRSGYDILSSGADGKAILWTRS